MVINVKKRIRLLKEIVKKYQITIIGSSTAFYVIVALFSFAVLAFQIYGAFSDEFQTFLLGKLFDIVNPLYHHLFSGMGPIFELNTFSVFIFLSLLWSASKVINGINLVADLVYEEVKDRKGIMNRISSFFMFLMLIFIIFFEIAFAVFADKLIASLFHNMIILKIVQFILEILIIYFTLAIIYIYAPPVKMHLKDVTFGTSVATALIYLASVILIIIINGYHKLNISYSLLTIISLFFFWIYIINIIVAFGIIINYRYNKKRA